MKRTTIYWILFFGVLIAISWIYSTRNSYKEPHLTKRDSNNSFNEIRPGDFYVLKNKKGEVYRFFKIVETVAKNLKVNALKNNPDYKIIGKSERNQKITILEGNLDYKDNFADETWIRKAIERPIYFEPKLRKVFKGFLFSLRNSTDRGTIYRLNYLPDELPFLLKFFLSPAMIFTCILIFFLFIWAAENINLYLKNHFRWFSDLLIFVISGIIFSGIAFLLINTILSYGYSNYFSLLGIHQLTERTILVPVIESTVIAIPFFILVWTIKRKFLQHLNFSDQEFYKFLLILIGGITYILILYITSWVATYLFDPLRYKTIIYRALQWDFIWLIGIEGILTCGMIATANFMNNLRKHVQQLKFKEKLLIQSNQTVLSTQSALNALQAKVNPHFLYNSLNSIASLAQTNPAKTEEMALALSDFYKHSTNRQEEHLSSLTLELKQLQSYLDIEKIRFGERLQYDFDIDEKVLKTQIPRFLLQPLVENAIKYGFNKRDDIIKITVQAEQIAHQLHLKITDSGEPFSGEMDTGYGLRSIKKKLKLLYPNAHELHFINKPIKQVHIILDRSKNQLYA